MHFNTNLNKHVVGGLLAFTVLAVPAAPMLAEDSTAQTQAQTVNLKVMAVEVKGNKIVPTEKILGMIKTKPGDTIASDKLEGRLKNDDLKGINASGLFADQVARYVAEGPGIKVIFEIVENPKLTGFEFKGNTMASVSELSPLLRTKVGEILNTNVLHEDMDRIVKYYAGKGGMIRIADIQVDKAGKLVTTISETKVAKIILTGNTKTKDKVILRELTTASGTLVDLNKIRAEQRRILNLGYFETITPRLEQADKPDEVNYVIELAERKKLGLASGGLGYSGADGLMGYLDVNEDNLMGNGQKLNLKLELGSKGTKTYELGFTEPWLDKHHTSLGMGLYNREVVRKETLGTDTSETSYVERRVGGDMTLGRPIDADTQLTMRLKTENTSTFDNKLKTFLDIPGNGITRSVTVGMDRDTRDNFMNPTNGYKLSASAERAGGALGGDNDFAKFEASASTYLKTWKDQTIALRLAGGQTLHTGALPLQESFRIGGSDTVRGLDYSAYKGDTMVNANAEYRFPIAKMVSGAVFADLGNAWMSSEGPKGLKLGAGAGVRLDTPLGLLRLDYGVAKGKTGDVQGKAYFSFGQTF